MTTADLRPALVQGAAELGLDLAPEQIDRLLDYLALIQKWNKVYNLTAVRSSEEMLTHHLLDSLAVVQPLRRQLANRRPTDGQGWRLLDVGSGAGLPGVVIAICCPDIAVTCVDAVAKKAAFVQQTALALKLSNLQGLHARVENLADRFDVVSSRALASLADFAAWSRSVLAPAGVWLAMKGRVPTAEQAALPPQVRAFHVEQLAVPGLAEQRCIVWMRPQGVEN